MANSTVTHDVRLLLRQRGDGQLTARHYAVRVLKRGGRKTKLVGSLIIGSGPEADVRVPDATVSRKHFSLTASANGVTLRDLGSKNGTMVKGVRVTEALLEESVVIQAASCQFELSVLDEAVPEPEEAPGFGAAIGESAVMRALFGMLGTVALSDSTVLLTGETGTGKGLLARELHLHSPRRRGAFVVVECGALGESLAESALFGHVRGAFTGADRDHEGAFLRAAGGTLFLEDVGELLPSLQPKLLRALESRTVQRVGSATREEVDVRVVAATSRPLTRPQFRSDLYYRLAVIELTVPPLRSRRGDARVLAQHFARLRGAVLPDDLLAHIESRTWPGNVRELQNAIERALVLDQMSAVLAAGEGLNAEPEQTSADDDERERITQALAACAGNQSSAAKLLGISRGTLISRIERLNLPRPRLKR